MGSSVDHTALVDLLLERDTEGALPDLVNEVHVAFTHRRVHQRRVSRDVLDRVAGGLQHGANGVHAGDLAGPVVDRQLDRIRRILSSSRGLGAGTGISTGPPGPTTTVVSQPLVGRILRLHAVNIDVHGQLGDIQVGEVHLLDRGIRSRPLVRETRPHAQLEIPILRVPTVMRGLRVDSPLRVGLATLAVLGELDELAVVHGLDEVRGPVEQHDRLLVGRSRLQGSPQSAGSTGVFDNEVHAETIDTLLVTLEPVHRTTKEAALAARIGRGEHLGTFVEGLPVGKAGTHVLDVGRVPPLLTGLGVVGGSVDHAALVDLLFERDTKGALPDLVNEVHVAFTH